MINLFDVTFKEFHKDFTLSSLIELVKKNPIQGINWWNANNFPFYFQTLHNDPWEILDTIEKNLKNVSIIIDVKGNQLNKRISFSEDVLEKFFQQFVNKNNFFLKIYDPLNDVEKIKKLIQIANKYKLNIIGGVFLRPDLDSFPEYHTELLSLYNDSNITHISLIEPLGFLKSGQIAQIKKTIDDYIKISQINLSFKHLRFEQSLLINEALSCGITEFDFDQVTNSFGYPSLEAIIHTLIYSKNSKKEKESLYNLYYQTKSDFAGFSSLEMSKIERELTFIQHPNIPIEVLESIKNLQYFTNVEFTLQTIITEIKKIQFELGNPPLIEPFLTIMISQAIFRLQNSNKGMKTLDTIKYISGYWGNSKEDLNGEFKKLIPTTKNLKSKSTIFNLTSEENENLDEKLKFYDVDRKDERTQLSFLISPEEANYYYHEFLPNPKSINFRNKENLAAIVKTIVEQQTTVGHDVTLPTISQNGQEGQSVFRWRYLSRLFQMGKF